MQLNYGAPWLYGSCGDWNEYMKIAFFQIKALLVKLPLPFQQKVLCRPLFHFIRKWFDRLLYLHDLTDQLSNALSIRDNIVNQVFLSNSYLFPFLKVWFCRSLLLTTLIYCQLTIKACQFILKGMYFQLS